MESTKYQHTKNIILNEYFSIGILEVLKESLQLFEVIMPQIFKNAVAAYDRDLKVLKSSENSKTLVKETISNETREYLEKHQFSYDIDLYRFIEAKFYIQYRLFVKPSGWIDFFELKIYLCLFISKVRNPNTAQVP